MKRKVAHIIGDILETIERVQSKIGGKTFAEFESDWYHTISNKVIWEVAQSDLPRLKTAIEAISASEKGRASSSEQ